MKTLKRVLAIVAALALLGSILAICLLLLNAGKYSDEILRGLISCLIAIPLIAYGYLILLRYAKRLSASLNSMSDEDNE